VPIARRYSLGGPSAQRRRSRGFGGTYGTLTAPVTFPATPMLAGSGIRVYVALNPNPAASYLTWNWLDITPRVRTDLGVSYRVGRRDQSSLVGPSDGQLKVTNTDGYLCRLNPASPYYGLLTMNTPIWIQLNPGSGFVDRYFGYVNEWPASWSDASGADSFITIRCGGIMRRLAQSGDVDDSLNRTILSSNPTYYWRMDDPSGSTFAASALVGGPPMVQQAGAVGWATLAAPPGGTNSAPDLQNGYLAANVSVAAPWTVEFSILRPTSGATDGPAIAQILYSAGGFAQVLGITTAADSTVSTNWHHYKLEGTQVGANWQVQWWKNGVDRGIASSGAGTLGPLTNFTAFGGYNVGLSGTPGCSVGYAAIYATAGAFTASSHSSALQAFTGELAHVRIARLCTEAGIPVYTQAPGSAAMGPQSADNLLNLLRECEAVDGGLLYEYQFGIGYQSVRERYNQPVAMALDFHQRHIAGVPAPTDDDQFTRNRWTISRSGGASVTATEANGNKGTRAIGVWPDSATLNVYADSQVAQEASWRVHLGTVDEVRWPSLRLQLHGGASSLIPTWLGFALGKRISLSNPPTQMAPDAIDAIVDGYSEAFNQVAWVAELNTTPASPYSVAVMDDPLLGRLDSATSTLTADVASGTTSISVTTTDVRDLWTTDAAEVPFDIIVAGEVMTVTVVSGASSPQTFTVTRSVNAVVKAQTAGAAIHIRYPATLAL